MATEARDLFRNIKMGDGIMPKKFKGHVKVILHNLRTGKNEIIEGDNIVTNLAAAVYGSDFLGAIDYANIMPLWQKLFGGLLYYENPFATSGSPAEPDPADYFVQGNDVNALKGHAGPTVPTGAQMQEDRTRGYRVDVVESDGKIKQVFEFGSLQGNGTISALALTHPDVGDAGTGNASSVFQSFQPFEIINGSGLTDITAGLTASENIFAQYDDSHGICFYIGDEGDYAYEHTRFATSKVTVYIKPFPFKKAGLFETMNANTARQRKFTVDTGVTFYNNPSFFFDTATKYLWLFTNLTGVNTYDADDINYVVIDCSPTASSRIVTTGTLTSDTANIAPLSMDEDTGSGWDYQASVPRFANIIKDGNLIWFPTSAGVDWGEGKRRQSAFNVNGLHMIDITGTVSQAAVTFNETQKQYRSAFKSGGLIINSGRVINGGVGYTCADQIPDADAYPTYTLAQPYGPVSYEMPIGGTNATPTRPRNILLNKLFHSTKYNLPAPVTKDSSKSLTVEYTLEEVTT